MHRNGSVSTGSCCMWHKGAIIRPQAASLWSVGCLVIVAKIGMTQSKLLPCGSEILLCFSNRTYFFPYFIISVDFFLKTKAWSQLHFQEGKWNP